MKLSLSSDSSKYRLPIMRANTGAKNVNTLILYNSTRASKTNHNTATRAVPKMLNTRSEEMNDKFQDNV
jgi:hypothetical protein